MQETYVRKSVLMGVAAAAMLTLAACGSTSRTISTLDGPAYAGPGFTNVLVLAIADNYDNRATFERELAKKISSGDTSAKAHYLLTNIGDPIDRPAIENLVEDGGFDAVLITRVLDSTIVGREKTGAAATKVSRKSDAFFRYDYEELNDPVTIALDVNVVISSELFSIASGKLVWAIESTISDKASVGMIVFDAADIVAQRLRRDGLVAR
jgi:hypothetical protein